MRRRLKENANEKAGAPIWLTTYSDLVTLLMTFFILLFAFSEIDAQKFQHIMESFRGTTGILESGRTIVPDELIEISNGNDEFNEIEHLKDILQQRLEDKGLLTQMSVILEEESLLLRPHDDVLFDPGKAIIKEDALEILFLLSDLLKSEDFLYNRILVEGHTDSDPVAQPNIYKTNWDLSVARAAHVVRFFIEEADMTPKRFKASGYSKYYPIAPNDTPGNKAQNRRVDIIILKDKI
ncbi:chemotaxis protein MotB [Natronincola peptidivorans]|uniref:Chemotaxis protein MotB n=1 Tax=Natronincola peptidivorans TaxID=426128 RepID=A0A1I0BFL4_9FIRM|nr:flagellar motor protein MotB [Natronincola peptidivorans]SET05588.1 chemotaxis protein MotB [Natronincola peptidivorans]